MPKKKITFADTFKVSDYEKEMDQLLLMIADFMDTEDKAGWVAWCLVSDKSILWDFMPNAEQQKRLGDKLGFPVCERDYMVAIAAKIRQLT
jgi:hypothetical protein